MIMIITGAEQSNQPSELTVAQSRCGLFKSRRTSMAQG